MHGWILSGPRRLPERSHAPGAGICAQNLTCQHEADVVQQRSLALDADRFDAQSKIAINTIGNDEPNLIDFRWRDLTDRDDVAENAWDEIAEGYANIRPPPLWAHRDSRLI